MKNKPIILSGCFYGTNYGDHLFCDIFKDNIDDKLMVKNASKYIQKISKCDSSNDLSILGAKAVVFASGGYMGEGDNERILKKLRRLRHHYIPAIFCRLLGIPYSVIGVGVGPNQHKLTKKIIKYVVTGADKITVRDIESKEYLESYRVKRKDILVTTDTAVTIPNKYDLRKEDEIIKSILSIVDKKMIKVFFHVDPSSYNSKENLYNEIVNLVNRDKNIYLIIGSDMISNVLEDVILKETFYSKLPQNRTYFFEYKEPWLFTSLLKNVDSIITHKLHVGILGTAFNKSVVSFPIHNKVIRYYKQIEAEERCLPLSNLSSAQIKEHIDSNLYLKYTMKQVYRNSSFENINVLSDFISAVNSKKK